MELNNQNFEKLHSIDNQYILLLNNECIYLQIIHSTDLSRIISEFNLYSFSKILFLMVYIRPLKIILDKKTTELVLLFHKNITKQVFLWPNMGQKCCKELTFTFLQVNNIIKNKIYVKTLDFSNVYLYIYLK